MTVNISKDTSQLTISALSGNSVHKSLTNSMQTSYNQNSGRSGGAAGGGGASQGLEKYRLTEKDLM